MSEHDVAVLGVGMHPWGKWGRNFVEYGVAAARDALADAGLSWTDVHFVSGADTIRNGYPGFISGATFAQALGWSGARVASSYSACASGASALGTARAHILAGLCDVALVVGADAAPKGFFAPVGGDRPDDPDWLRFRLLGATNPTYFALYARRRMEVYGATEHDFARVKVKNARHGLANPNARYRKEVTEDEVLASPVVADPLRLLEICATSDGGAALVVTSMDFARRHTSNPVTIAGVSTVTPRFPNTVIEMPNFATDSACGVALPEASFRDSIAEAAYAEAGIGPDDLDLAEVYDLSSALELDWYENIGLCKEGEAERLLNDGDTTIGGRIPVNPSGGLACFGEAVPAQAIAQVCELTWQLRGQATGRQVEGARVGLTINQGLFGHGSSVIARVCERPEAYLVDAVRTPVGRRGGGLSAVHPADLGAHVIRALFDRNDLDPLAVDDVFFGCVDAIGPQAGDIARTAWLAAGLPEEIPGTTIDRQCGSSQQALHFAAQAVMSGTNDVVVAGGVQNMSMIPIASAMSVAEQFGFTDPFSGSEGWRARYGDQEVSQFRGAELIAEKWAISRDEMEAFAVESHLRAIRATEEGRFDREIVPLAGVTRDEGPREPDREKIKSLRTLVDGGRLTAAVSSQISDAASAVLVASEAAVRTHGLKPRARVHHLSCRGGDPIYMLTAPIPATAYALQRTGMSLDDIDRVEINEAFASVVLAWQKETGADLAHVNVNGGAIALGHPLGATGTRLMATLLCELERTGGRYGLQTMCEGGGQANVTIIERLG